MKQDLIKQSLDLIRERDGRIPEVALILGSGLGVLAEKAEEVSVFPGKDLPGYPESTVPGHEGSLVIGQLEGRTVAFIKGRVHAYEGVSREELTYPLRLLHGLGARRLILTNAAGGISPRLERGSLMLISDHINSTMFSPIIGLSVAPENPFPDMSNPYDADWSRECRAIAAKAGVALQEGTYCWTFGPTYETPAEIEFIRRIGGDAVGMSTVPEAILASKLGMKVLGISTITNKAAGLDSAALDHEDVLAVSASVRQSLETLVRQVLNNLT